LVGLRLAKSITDDDTAIAVYSR